MGPTNALSGITCHINSNYYYYNNGSSPTSFPYWIRPRIIPNEITRGKRTGYTRQEKEGERDGFRTKPLRLLPCGTKIDRICLRGGGFACSYEGIPIHSRCPAPSMYASRYLYLSIESSVFFFFFLLIFLKSRIGVFFLFSRNWMPEKKLSSLLKSVMFMFL